MFALVDCNNFYVSCERVFDYSLHNRPVAVLSNNDGCVISRSNELKALGVKMGTPFFKLKPFLQRYNIAVRSSNYDLYGDMSRRVMCILEEFTPDIELYSIDEAFLLFSHSEKVDYLKLAYKIRARVMKCTGLPVGVGFALTRTLAKTANHIAKDTGAGAYVMPSKNGEILKKLPVKEIWGVGRRFAKRMGQIGIHTAEDLSRQPENYLRKRFNVCVARTALELSGVSALESEDIQEPSKSISCSRSFSHPVTKFEHLAEAVAKYTAQAAVKVRKEKQKATGMSVYFQYYPDKGGSSYHGSSTASSIVFDKPVSATSEILTQVKKILPELFIKGKRYKKAGILFFGLEQNHNEQLDLFDFSNQLKSATNQKLYETVDKLNQRYGRGKVFHLSEGIDRPWQMKREHLSPQYTTNWAHLPEVN